MSEPVNAKTQRGQRRSSDGRLSVSRDAERAKTQRWYTQRREGSQRILEIPCAIGPNQHQRYKPTKPMNQPLILLSSVTKAYTTAAGDYLALRGIDLRIEPGEFVAIVGKSGSGKSTLLNVITGIDRASSGEVLVAGADLMRMPAAQMAAWRGRTVGIVFQFFQLLPTLTALENVMLPMDFANLGSLRERRARALALLERVGLADQAEKLPLALSGGQQQRVAIARALANNPPLLVADEPTGNLDSQTAEAVFELFVELAGLGTTIVMVTHDSELARRAGRMVLVADGHIVG